MNEQFLRFNSEDYRKEVNMKTEIIFVVEESLDGEYEAHTLGNSIFTEAENLDDLKRNIKEAVACHFEEGEMPKIIRLHYIKEEVIAA
jgi:hypothetical protein